MWDIGCCWGGVVEIAGSGFFDLGGGGMEKKHYIKIKKSEIDICNICGQRKKLSWDHVPPQCQNSLFIPEVYANTLFRGVPNEKAYMKKYQSGIKFRTICEKCNNVVLGENDNEYKTFLEDIVEKISKISDDQKNKLDDSVYITVSCKINRILRVVCGHMLAAKEEYDSEVNSDVYMREYVLNENLKMENIKVFAWFYPYSSILIARDFTCQGHIEDSHPKGLISIISCFPISFVLSTDDEVNCRLDDLSRYTTENIDDVADVKLHLGTLIHKAGDRYKEFNWPVNISNDKYGALFVLGNGTIMEDSRMGVRIIKKR